MNISTGVIKLYGLVRDKNGKPKIDDINNIHPKIWEMLTDIEQEEIKNGRNTSRTST